MSAQDIGADELVARLSGNDPRSHVANPDPAVRAVWRRAIDAVRREHLTPPGKRLRHTGRDRGDLVIWLEPVEQAPPVRPDRLLVPSEVVEAHPLLGSPEELGRHLDVEPASLPRALRLLQVFVEAAEARRYTVAWAAAFSTLALERDGHTETVECGEEREHRAVAPTAAELADKAPRYSWQRVQPNNAGWRPGGCACSSATTGIDGDGVAGGRTALDGDSRTSWPMCWPRSIAASTTPSPAGRRSRSSPASARCGGTKPSSTPAARSANNAAATSWSAIRSLA